MGRSKAKPSAGLSQTIPMPDSAAPKNMHDVGPRPCGFAQDAGRVLEAMQDGVMFLDYQWRIVYANPNARRYSRVLEEHLNSKSHWELYPDTVGTELERRYRGVMETRVEDHYAFYYEPLDLWTEIHILPIEIGLALIYSNLTVQKREEAARLAAQRQLEQVLEVTTDAVVYLDRNYSFTFLNRRASEVLAASGKLLGRNLWKCYPDAFYEGSPFVVHFARAMDDRVAGSFLSYYGAPLNMWLDVQARPASDGIIVFFRDVTEERRNQEILRLKQEESDRQRAEIEAVYQTAPVGLALFDPVEFRYLRVNDYQAAFFGIPREQILGQVVTDMAPIEGVRELFERVAQGEPVRDHLVEGELSTHPGEHRYWTVNYHPVYGTDGSVQAISSVSAEITRLKQAEAALIQSEKLAAVGRLAQSISHEINNPLEAITNILYLVAMHEELTPAIRKYVEVAQSELARVSQIATQTLRFHRQSVNPTRLTAEQMVSAVLDLYQGRLVNSGITIETRYCSHTPVRCFENDIRQVLNNLIANAIDAMRTGGRLLVRAHDTFDRSQSGGPADEPRRGVRITIADTGHGMSPATLARIFEPFYTTKDLNGTGLGLWISAEIVARHHGRLTVRSCTGPGPRGTAFSLFLPLDGQ